MEVTISRWSKLRFNIYKYYILKKAIFLSNILPVAILGMFFIYVGIKTDRDILQVSIISFFTTYILFKPFSLIFLKDILLIHLILRLKITIMKLN